MMRRELRDASGVQGREVDFVVEVADVLGLGMKKVRG